MRFSVRSIFLVIAILALAVSLFDFSWLRYHPIQEHQFPSDHRARSFKVKLNDSARSENERTIYYGTRESKSKGGSRQLTYVVITDDSGNFSHEAARKLASRLPRRQLHQILSGKHVSSSRSIACYDLEELLAMEPLECDIDLLIDYADRRKHWKSKGLDLSVSGYLGGTNVDAHYRMCKRAFGRDREEVLAWLSDYPVKRAASSNFAFVDHHDLSFEKAIWLLNRLGDDPAYSQAHRTIGLIHSLSDQAEPREPFLAWAQNLRHAELKRSALTGMMERFSEWSNTDAFQFALINLEPDDFYEVDKLWEQGVPAIQISEALTWWSARERFLDNDPYVKTSTIAFNSASPDTIRALLEFKDDDLVDNILPEMFRGWRWYARAQNKQSELGEVAQLWKALPIYRQLGTLKHLLEAIEELEPRRVPDFVADLEDVRLRDIAESVLAKKPEPHNQAP